MTGTVATNDDEDTSDLHAFVYQNGRMRDIGTLGGDNSHGYGINNRGQVTGRSTLSPDADVGDIDAFHAFIYENNRMYDLNSLISEEDPFKSHVTLESSYAINDFGVIEANGLDAETGYHHAYRLTPVLRIGTWIAKAPDGQQVDVAVRRSAHTDYRHPALQPQGKFGTHRSRPPRAT